MRTTPTNIANQNSYALLAILLCGAFLFYKYILQVYPSIITEQLMREYHLSGAGLGNLAATFYYSYMIAQLFVGVLLDKYSTRLLTSIAIFGCAVGILLFALTHNLLVAQLSRALMGIGVAFATVAYMKVAAMWFSPRRYAFIAGLLASAAMAGAVFSQAPLTMCMNALGWRPCLFLVSLTGFALAVAFFIWVRDKKTSVAQIGAHEISLQDISEVFKNKKNWLLTFYSGLAFSPVAVFGGLWGNPFLVEAYHINKTMAASLVSLVFLGLGVGSPLLGMLSDHLGERRHVMFYSTLTSCVCIALVLYCHALPLSVVSFLLFLFGFGIGAFMLVFAIGKELNDIRLTATVIAMINASEALLDAITEPSIGKLLDFTWNGSIVNGVHHFSLHSYYVGLSVLPLYLLIASLLLLRVNKT